MDLLLRDELAPITSTIGFVEVDMSVAVGAFSDWQASVSSPLGMKVAVNSVGGSLREVISRLLPLTAPRRQRFLFLPTRSRWLAYFDNGIGGSDAPSTCMYLARMLSCRAVRLTAIPHTISRSSKSLGRFGARTLELFGPGGDPLGYLRSISVSNDGGSWAFDQSGEPLAFEREEKYKQRPVPDRFTLEDLHDYAAELTLRPFDEEFYLSRAGELVEITGKRQPNLVEMTLEQVRASF